MLKKIREFKFEYLLMAVIIIQPLIDIYRTFFQNQISISVFNLEELINIVLIGCVAIVALVHLIDSKDKKHLMLYGFYFGLLVVYLVLHVLNVSKFDVSIFPQAELSHIHNIYYILRAYVMPITLMISVYTLGMDDRKFLNAIKCVSLIISGVIVITNITGISLVSYSMENEQILGGITSWGSLHADSEFELYTSKGFFYSANQMSSLLFAMMPIIVGEFISHCNWKNGCIMALQALAMLMVGTKTASQGTLIALAFVLMVALVLHFLKTNRLKQVMAIPLVGVLLISSYGIYLKSPSKLRLDYMKYLEAPENDRDEKDVPDYEGDQMIQYINENYWFYYINEEYMTTYPVKDHLDFWKSAINRDRRLNRDNRNLKVFMINNIVKDNENPMDQYLGIGFKSNVPYTERDYLYQSFIFGLIGVLFLMGPFFAAVLYAGIRILKDFKHKATLLNFTLGIALCSYFVTAYIAGHTFGILINMIFMAFYAGKLLHNVKN